MMTGINESKTLTKHIPYKCKCKFHSKKCNSKSNGIMELWNNDKCQCECKNCQTCKENYI